MQPNLRDSACIGGYSLVVERAAVARMTRVRSPVAALLTSNSRRSNPLRTSKEAPGPENQRFEDCPVAALLGNLRQLSSSCPSISPIWTKDCRGRKKGAAQTPESQDTNGNPTRNRGGCPSQGAVAPARVATIKNVYKSAKRGTRS